MPPPPIVSDVIILGASARAAAHSAQRASLRSWCCDLFVDQDLVEVAEVADRCAADVYPWALVDWLDRAALPSDAPVLLTGALENHARLVAAVAGRRPLWTPGPAAILAVRDPRIFATLPLPGSVVPCATAVDAASIARWHAGEAGPTAFLSKPRFGAAGRGIHRGPHRPAGRSQRYCQAYVEGLPISVVYRAGSERTACLGVTRQLIGEAAFGAGGFRYCGNIGPLWVSPSQREGLMALGEALVQRCGLCGLFGIDAIIDQAGCVRPLEVNPRYTAGIEVLERAGTAPVLAAFGRERDGSHDVDAAHATVTGKAVVYARDDGVTPALASVLGGMHVADVPAAGTFVRRDEPICTVLASAGDGEACEAALRRLAAKVYAVMGEAEKSPRDA